MSLSRNVFLRVFLRRRSDRCHGRVDHRWWDIPAAPLQSRCIPYYSHRWRNAKCGCICCLQRFCIWNAAFEWQSNNESLDQTRMLLLQSYVHLPLSVRALSQSLHCCLAATEVTAYSIRQVRRNSGPTAGALERNHRIHHVCTVFAALSANPLIKNRPSEYFQPAPSLNTITASVTASNSAADTEGSPFRYSQGLSLETYHHNIDFPTSYDDAFLICRGINPENFTCGISRPSLAPQSPSL